MSNPPGPVADNALDGLYDPAPLPPMSARQKAWQALLDLAPDLKGMNAPQYPQQLPPTPLANGLFLALCACLIDPRKRAVLRALFLDLLDDDIRKLILSFLQDEAK